MYALCVSGAVNTQRFCVEVFYALYINFHSFIHSFIQTLKQSYSVITNTTIACRDEETLKQRYSVITDTTVACGDEEQLKQRYCVITDTIVACGDKENSNKDIPSSVTNRNDPL